MRLRTLQEYMDNYVRDVYQKVNHRTSIPKPGVEFYEKEYNRVTENGKYELEYNPVTFKVDIIR
jgi:hypothetical protein